MGIHGNNYDLFYCVMIICNFVCTKQQNKVIAHSCPKNAKISKIIDSRQS